MRSSFYANYLTFFVSPALNPSFKDLPNNTGLNVANSLLLAIGKWPFHESS